MTNPHIGSLFKNFLKEEGIRDTAHVRAIKRVLAWQIAEAMKARGFTKSEMAKRMSTSRAQLDRLLDPENDKVQLDTLQRAAEYRAAYSSGTRQDVAASVCLTPD